MSSDNIQVHVIPSKTPTHICITPLIGRCANVEVCLHKDLKCSFKCEKGKRKGGANALESGGLCQLLCLCVAYKRM